MKFVSIAAALALGLAPVAGIAQGTSSPSGTQTVEPGGTSQDGLPVLAASQIPFEAIIAGGFVLVGGVIVGVLAATGETDPTPTTTTTN